MPYLYFTGSYGSTSANFDEVLEDYLKRKGWGVANFVSQGGNGFYVYRFGITATSNTTAEINRIKNGIASEMRSISLTDVIVNYSSSNPTPTNAANTTNIGNAKLTYTVVRGDTLSKIAAKFKTTVANLANLNGLVGNAINNLAVGQRILVDGSIMATPITPTATGNNPKTNTPILPPPSSSKSISDYIKENQTYIYAAAAIGAILLLMEE